ncbi:MAG: hypothetical protein ACI9J3_003394 [Parvicellaceae bacterium]|jgi:hypothetical protein
MGGRAIRLVDKIVHDLIDNPSNLALALLESYSSMKDDSPE